MATRTRTTLVQKTLDERTEADAQDAERELWARTGAVEKAAGIPRHEAMARVLELDPTLARRLQDAPEPVAKVTEPDPVPMGAAGRQLDAIAAKVVEKGQGRWTYAEAYAGAVDQFPALAEAADAEMWGVAPPVAKSVEPLSAGPAGTQLDALADEIVKAEGIARPQAVLKAFDRRPDLAEAVLAEQAVSR